jgi:hypothetical protein
MTGFDHLGSFSGEGSDGRYYVIVEYREIPHAHDNTGTAPRKGSAAYRTDAGKHVTRLSRHRYRITGTDIEITVE